MIVNNSYLKYYHSKEPPTVAPIPNDLKDLLQRATEDAAKIQSQIDLYVEQEEQDDFNHVINEHQDEVIVDEIEEPSTQLNNQNPNNIADYEQDKPFAKIKNLGEKYTEGFSSF